MANPQVENGYVRISNELLEALARIRIPGEARQVLDVILRKTYGFNKKEDHISLSQLALATGLKRANIGRALRKLRSMNLIIEKDTSTANIRRINKDFDTWRGVSKVIPGGIQSDNRVVSKVTHTKDNITKDNKRLFVATSDEVRLAELLFDLMKRNNANAKKPNIQTWAKHIDLMIRRDERTPSQIEAVIRWCQSSAFWSANILSTKKLREKFDQLTLHMKRNQSTGGNNAAGTGRTFASRAEQGDKFGGR